MIAGRPSATALLVALSVLRRGRDFDLPASSLRIAGAALDHVGGGWRALARLARGGAGRMLLDAIERVAMPGLAAHHCRRKRWLHERLRGLPPGTRLIWPAVGFDGTGIAVCERDPSVRLHELDHPDTLRVRDAVAGTMPRLERGALRLPDDSVALLALCDGPAHRGASRVSPSFPPRAVLVVEGLAMYLSPRPLLRLLRTLATLPAPPRLLFTALAPVAAGGRGFVAENGIVRHWLSRRREPFLWRCAQPRMRALLQDAGYRIEAEWDGAGFGEYAFDVAPVPRAVSAAP